MKQKNLLIFLPIVAFSLTSCGSQVRHECSEYKAGELSFDDESFKILQLTDTHISDKDDQQLQFDFLNLTITDAKNDGVDLIVLDGDLFTFAGKETAHRFFAFMDSYNIPWTATFGNHDEQCMFSVTWLTSYLNELSNSSESNCIFKDIQDDDVFGHANFYIDVKRNNKLFERLIVMDSNRYYFSDYFGYDYLKQDQIDWYKRVSDDSPITESLLFFHIPLPEFQTAYDLYKKGSSEVEYLFGENGEGVSAPKYNSGMFEMITKLGQTKAVFVGHDHANDSAIIYKEVLLSYGTNSTDRIYYEEDKLGGQIITLKDNHELELKQIHHHYSELEEK